MPKLIKIYQLGFRTSYEAASRLEILAKEQDRSVSSLVREAVDQYLDRLNGKNQSGNTKLAAQ